MELGGGGGLLRVPLRGPHTFGALKIRRGSRGSNSVRAFSFIHQDDLRNQL